MYIMLNGRVLFTFCSRPTATGLPGGAGVNIYVYGSTNKLLFIPIQASNLTIFYYTELTTILYYSVYKLLGLLPATARIIPPYL